MKKTIIYLAGICAFILVFSTCKHKPDVVPAVSQLTDTVTQQIKDTSGNQNTSPCSADTVYFSNTILPLIISSCATAGCHDATSRVEGLNLTSYANIMKIVRAGNPGGSKLYTHMSSSREIMPPSGRLPQAQLDLISKWISQGAKNNFCDGNSGPCDSMNVSYAKALVPVINTYCKGCHNSANPSQGVNLDNYGGVQTVAANGQLMDGLTGKLSRMPKYGAALNACTISKFRQWIKEGAKNN